MNTDLNFNPIIVLFLTLQIIIPSTYKNDFNPIIVLFLTVPRNKQLQLNIFQSYYSLISNLWRIQS